MVLTWIWVVLFVVFAVLEALTLNLVTIWFAAGSLVMVFLSFFEIDLIVQIAIFIFISSLLLISTRPILKRFVNTKKEKTNSDAIIGKEAVVVKNITKDNFGEVKINGNIWTAKSFEDINEGDNCIISEIEGCKVIVKKI